MWGKRSVEEGRLPKNNNMYLRLSKYLLSIFSQSWEQLWQPDGTVGDTIVMFRIWYWCLGGLYQGMITLAKWSTIDFIQKIRFFFFLFIIILIQFWTCMEWISLSISFFLLIDAYIDSYIHILIQQCGHMDS